MMDSRGHHDQIELGVHVEYTEPYPSDPRIIAENMKYCFLYIPTGEMFISRVSCDITDFSLCLGHKTCIEEWESVPLPSIKVINEMRLSQVIY